MGGFEIRSGKSRVTCLLADDNEHIVEALDKLLRQEGVEVVGRARTGLEALQLLDQRPATAIVLDLRLPDLSGLDVARLAAEGAFQTPVILYTSHADAKLVRDALDAGARGVVRKDASPENLLQAIRAIADGAIYVDPQLVGA